MLAAIIAVGAAVLAMLAVASLWWGAVLSGRSRPGRAPWADHAPPTRTPPLSPPPLSPPMPPPAPSSPAAAPGRPLRRKRGRHRR